MCGRKSKMLWLCLVVFFPLFSLSCFADVRLTETEAQEILSEIEESKKDLQNVRAELETSRSEVSELQKESSEQKLQLKELQDISNEQKESYEKQLKEAEKKSKLAWTLTGISGTGCTLLAVLLALALL